MGYVTNKRPFKEKMFDFDPWCNIKVSWQEFSLSFCVALVHHLAFSPWKNTRTEETVLIVAFGDAEEGFLGVSRFECYYHKVSLA